MWSDALKAAQKESKKHLGLKICQRFYPEHFPWNIHPESSFDETLPLFPVISNNLYLLINKFNTNYDELYQWKRFNCFLTARVANIWWRRNCEHLGNKLSTLFCLCYFLNSQVFGQKYFFLKTKNICCSKREQFSFCRKAKGEKGGICWGQKKGCALASFGSGEMKKELRRELIATLLWLSGTLQRAQKVLVLCKVFLRGHQGYYS